MTSKQNERREHIVQIQQAKYTSRFADIACGAYLLWMIFSKMKIYLITQGFLAYNATDWWHMLMKMVSAASHLAAYEAKKMQSVIGMKLFYIKHNFIAFICLTITKPLTLTHISTQYIDTCTSIKFNCAQYYQRKQVDRCMRVAPQALFGQDTWDSYEQIQASRLSKDYVHMIKSLK